MKITGIIAFSFSLFFIIYSETFALEPNEILVIVNSDIPESVRIAQHYCARRDVPENNILALSLGLSLDDSISRQDYDRQLAEPIREKIFGGELIGKIKCLLTIYGVPIKVEGRGILNGQEDKLAELKDSAQQEKKKGEKLNLDGLAESSEYKQSTKRLAQLQQIIDRISGKETNASVDSELSMVLFDSYELYRWQPNLLKDGSNDFLGLGSRILMVSRLDGPDFEIVIRLVDKAAAAEKTGLKGIAYIDSRGFKSRNQFGKYDESLRNLAGFTRSQTNIPVKEERAAQLFAPGSCPKAAIYCGWYSLKKYVDAFDFVEGAIGYHIASFEAVNLRDPNSSQWCPAMLRDGITATLGAVAEPYLHTFPEPREFFAKLYEGNCLVEAYYRTKPFNSWQLLLIGDPLYRPFIKPPWKNS